jgi:glycosyltransferase involved in cell wall biosynthesis
MQVSVLIPLYNAEQYIAQAIESALEQPETAEVLVWDDCSTDGSLAIAREFKVKYDRVRVFANSTNMGNYAVRNRLIAHSRYEYVAFLDADDYFLPGRFTVPKQIFENDPTVEVVYEAFENFYENPEKQRLWKEETSLSDRLIALPKVCDPSIMFRVILSQDNSATGMPQLVLKKSIFKKIPPFNERLRRGADRVALYQMAYLCRFAPGRLTEPVMMRRMHSLNISGQGKSTLFQALAFVCWARKSVCFSEKKYINKFLLRYKDKMFPLRFILAVRPYRVSYQFRGFLRRILVVVYFPFLLCSLDYWSDFFCFIVCIFQNRWINRLAA